MNKSVGESGPWGNLPRVIRNGDLGTLTDDTVGRVERLEEGGTQAPPGSTRKATGIRFAGNSLVGDVLLERTQGLEQEQQALLEGAPLEQTYQEALALYAQAKHAQVEQIEDRIENLIDRQQARLQHTQANTPGLLSMPSAKRAWQARQTQQQARLRNLHNRLETVREIKEGMGIHAPKIEELATRKMRAENPELASDWDAMREAARRHQALMRKQERERKQTHEQRQGRSQSLGLSKPL